MNVRATSATTFEIDLFREELRILGGCINEALEIGNDQEFRARLGADRSEALESMRVIREAYRRT